MFENLRFYKANNNLKAAGVQVPFTEENVKEYIKCAKDPIYFIENYAKIVSLDEGVVPFKLFEFQKDLIRAMHENRNTIGLLPRQFGKCCFADTIIRLRNKKTGKILEITMEDFFMNYARREKA